MRSQREELDRRIREKNQREELEESERRIGMKISFVLKK